MSIADFFLSLATDQARGWWVIPVRAILWVGAWLYGVIVRCTRMIEIRRRRRMPCVVVSVGNITLGGTGKTPLVEQVAVYLKKHGKKPAVISRGYGDVEGDKADEPRMLRRMLADIPVITGRHRIRAIHQAIASYTCDTVILDDGFQQWRIVKDLEIVVVDAVRGFGNMQMVPRGVLREPLRALQRAHICVLSKTDRAGRVGVESVRRIIERYAPAVDIVEAEHRITGWRRFPDISSHPVERLCGKRVFLFSGIGDPSSFEDSMISCGVVVCGQRVYADHHQYTIEEIALLSRSAVESGAEVLITTEKDAVRLGEIYHPEQAGVDLLIVRVSMCFTSDEQKLLQRLVGLGHI